MAQKLKLKFVQKMKQKQKQPKFSVLTDEREVPQQEVSVRRSQWYDCLKRMFSKKYKRKKAIEKASNHLQSAMDTLIEKELDLLQKHDQEQLLLLKATNNKEVNVAIQHLRKKKYYAKKLQMIRTHKFNLELQKVAMEESSTNAGIVKTMEHVRTALRTVKNQFNLEQIDHIYDDFNSLIDDTAEQSDALNIELQGTFHEISDEDLTQEINDMIRGPQHPPPPAAAAVLDFPTVPTTVPENPPDKKIEEGPLLAS